VPDPILLVPWQNIFSRTLAVLVLAGTAQPGARGDPSPGFKECQPGPWGRIEYQTMYLSAPDAILEEFPMPNPEPRWCFADCSPEAVRATLTAAGLDPAVRDRLFADPRAKRDEEGVFTVFPSVAEVDALKPGVRTIIYHELAKYPQNPYYYEPIVVPDGDVDAWLHGTGLADTVVSLIRSATYRDGDALLFSDFRSLVSHAANDNEARRWIKALTRTRTVVAYLRVDETDDLPALRRYWSANYHRKDSLPMLSSSATARPPTVTGPRSISSTTPKRMCFSTSDSPPARCWQITTR
jgi:hypothetical protein